MTDFITSIFSKINEIVTTVGSQLDDLVTRLDDVQFDENFAITKFLGLIHYVLGDPMYQMFCTMILIGAGFLLWKLIKIVINTVSSFIPGLKGRIKVE